MELVIGSKNRSVEYILNAHKGELQLFENYSYSKTTAIRKLQLFESILHLILEIVSEGPGGTL